MRWTGRDILFLSAWLHVQLQLFCKDFLCFVSFPLHSGSATDAETPKPNCRLLVHASRVALGFNIDTLLDLSAWTPHYIYPMGLVRDDVQRALTEPHRCVVNLELDP